MERRYRRQELYKPVTWWKNTGFSLLELMVVLTIVSLLLLMAFPSYQGQLNQANETKAKTQLYQLANLLEQNFRVHQSYQTALTAQWKTTHDSDLITYTIETSENHYVLRADLVKHQDNLKLSLHHTGQQFHTLDSGESKAGWP